MKKSPTVSRVASGREFIERHFDVCRVLNLEGDDHQLQRGPIEIAIQGYPVLSRNLSGVIVARVGPNSQA